MARTSRSLPRTYPAHTLERAIVIIQAIVDKGAGKSMDKLLLADAIGRTPNSSEFRRLLSSSLKYGLTIGTEKADYIAPTELGLTITKPESDEDVLHGRVKACMTPTLFADFYKQFNRNKLPDPTFLKNTLEKSFDVDANRSQEVAKLLVENAKYCGILQDISGVAYIRIENPQPPVSDPPSPESDEGPHQPMSDKAPRADSSSPDGQNGTKEPGRDTGPRQLFVAHGKNRQPLEDLKKILDGFKIRYKVATDEPHKGRPISLKVAELMNDCSAGVFIFTRDEQFFRKDGDGEFEEVWRPSENVVYELGAASILWDKKIIILKEEGVNFPSDFSDLGYINFNDGELQHKALELLKELVGLQLVKVEAA